MKLACITVFCNEEFRLQNWLQYFEGYKNDISLHVIVNNGTKEDTPLLEKSFPSSVVLESEGKNLLRAYNEGLRYVLQDKEIDAIMQITNDVKFERGALPELYKQLFSDDRLAIIGPVLLSKDSYTIETYGIDTHGNNLVGGGRYSRISAETWMT